MPIVLLMMIALAQPQPVLEQGPFTALFDECEYRYTGGRYRDELFHYRLFVPCNGSDAGKFPLIVWLHGFGEGGHDNLSHLRWLDRFVLPFPWDRERFPFYLLAVQCAPDNRQWAFADYAAGDNMVDVAAAIVKAVTSEHPIDPDRVYLSGVSSGGTGCWDFVVRYPQLFAAVAPFASAGTAQPDLSPIRDIPIWAFHSCDDRITPVEDVRRSVKRLKSIGGTVVLTEVRSVHHDCWSEAFSNYHVLDWLLSQRRGQLSWHTSPSAAALTTDLRTFAASWKWWQVLVQMGIPLTLIGVFAVMVKRSRRAGRSPLPSAPHD